MATVTHYIYSHYDPEEREILEEETKQHVPDKLTPDEAWQKEAPRLSNRLRAPPPQFVPATISYDDWSSATSTIPEPPKDSSEPLGNSLSGWYRSLTSSRNSPIAPSNSDSLSASIHQSTSTYPENAKIGSSNTVSNIHEPRNRNNWFIMNAIQSEPSSSESMAAPSLAEILARDPPPLPSEGKYNPPVWLEIGPSNRGFGMLQRSGWNEGEALGPDVVRRKPLEILLPGDDIIPAATDVKIKGKARRKNPLNSTTKRATVEVKVENMDDVSEIRHVDVIDLTMSDSELEDDDSDANATAEDGDLNGEEDSPAGQLEEHRIQDDHMPHDVDNSAYARKALLTPIATVLKSDRLGIGLKAKTVGPHKASQKRVTHSVAALAAHVKAAEESRRRRKLFGRGKRGFEKQHRREEENRKAMIAYLKGP